MTFEWLALAALALVGWFWFDTNRAREAGVRAARDGCRREGVQLLDETVAFRSMRFARDDNGHLALQRVYDFEYSDSGNDRFHGTVMLLRDEVVMLDVSAHHRLRLVQ